MYIIQDLGKQKDENPQYLVYSYKDEEDLVVVDKSNDIDELAIKYSPHKVVDEYFVAQIEFNLIN